MHEIKLFKLLNILLVLALTVAQECPVNIPEEERRECYPWINGDEEKCNARGCVWCETETEGIPFCFFDDTVCPSDIPEGDRVDCLPDGGSKSDCNQNNCIWCETLTPEVPFCFEDPSVSQGGELCPNDIDSAERIDCHPEPDVTVDKCVQRGCYYCESAEAGEPWCFSPKQRGYKMVGEPEETPSGYLVQLSRIKTPSWYGAEIENILLEVEFQTEDRLRLKFTDADKPRWEVPIRIGDNTTLPDTTLYGIEFNNDPVFSLKVTRVSTGAVILDTSIGGLTFSDQFIQFSTYLESGKIYGLGEHEHQSFPHTMNWTQWGMWTRDQAVETSNLYGQQPFYMNLETSNDAHGVLFLNSNAQDVTLLPYPALTFKTIGGILDMYVYMGPTPEAVIEKYHNSIGNPSMPPYWSLGFQLCRWGYEDLEHMKAAVDRMRQYNIPHDVQYGDIDYMYNQRDFTLDEENFGGLPEYIQQLKSEGTRFVIILDPGIYKEAEPGEYPPFERGLAADAWVKDADGETDYPGEVWPGPVYYPDFSKQSCIDWWIEECVLFKEVLDYEGLWIDMNEPSSFVDGRPLPAVGCDNTQWNSPPYLPAIADNLWKKTMCMEAVQEMGDFYNVHSLYGWSMSYASYLASREATGLRSITYSRSTFPGTGQWAQHWLGDNWSEWDQLRWSIYGMFEFNMFGMPYVGADICGFIGATTEELCARWQQLGAFYPFSRNHNADEYPDQDPGMWPSVGQIAADSLRVRYTLLPYLYSLFHLSHAHGGTVVRPLFFEFAQDEQTHSIGDQFLWGSGFMISPVLDEGVTSLNVYFPDAAWYDYYDGSLVDVRGDFLELDAPLEKIHLHVRGGSVLPVQQPANSTMFSRLNPMGVLVALDDNQAASGFLYWDDGESQDPMLTQEFYETIFTVENGVLTSEVVKPNYDPELYFETVTVYGEFTEVTGVTVNGDEWTEFTHDSQTGVLVISGLELDLFQDYTMEWN